MNQSCCRNSSVEVSLPFYSRVLDGRDMPTNWMFCGYLKMVFTLRYRKHDFLISFLPTCIYFCEGLCYIIFSAIEIQCHYLYDGNKDDTLMSECNVEAEWGSNETINKTAFLIKKFLKTFKNAKYFFTFFSEMF